jgi:hypothetical protein
MEESLQQIQSGIEEIELQEEEKVTTVTQSELTKEEEAKEKREFEDQLDRLDSTM